MPIALVLAYYFAVGVPIDPVNVMWALLNIVIFHAAGNVWSDAFDYLCGVDNQNTHGVDFLSTVSSLHGNSLGSQFFCLPSEHSVRFFLCGKPVCRS